MGFEFNFKIDSSKLYWTLSSKAIKVIDSDRVDYNHRKESVENKNENESFKITDMYNAIFRNYHEHAMSSVVHYAENIGLCNDSDNDKNVYSIVYQIIKNKYLNGKGEKQNCRIQKENFKILERSEESMVYGKDKAGVYFRAVLEEYASLPTFEREKYLYIDNYRDAEKYMKRKACVNIKTINSNSCDIEKNFVITHLMPDRYSNHYYIVCLNYENMGLQSFRLTNIVKINHVNNKKDMPDKEQIDEANKQVREKDVSYISSEVFDIKVKLTKNGISLLNKVVHNRPVFKLEKDDICIFTGAEFEISNYLHNFGEDAVVLDHDANSEKTRKNLREFYEKAAAAYK